jgi:endonuclease I
MKKLLLVLFMFIAANLFAQLTITGVVDGPLTGGTPKAIELFAYEGIEDLSIYGLESANNGSSASGEEFTLPADGVSAGTFIYVASESPNFNAFFGSSPNYTDGIANINGDDAIILYKNGSIFDVAGDVGTDGTGTAWDHVDGWMYRNNDTGPSTTFNLSEWSFSGTDALDGETSNSTAEIPFPIGTYTKDGGGGEPPSTPIATAGSGITSSSFVANWNAAGGANSYQLDVSTSNDFSSFVAGFNNEDVGNTTSQTVTGLTASTPYYYRIRASNGNGTSGNSNTITVNTTAPANTIVQFTGTTGSVNESNGTFDLVFSISDPSGSAATTFDVAITGGDGSAADVDNYTTQQVTFPAGSSSNETLQLTISNDGITEGNEDLIFSIQNVSGGTSASVGTNSSFTLTISDPASNNYYSGINGSLTGSALKAALNNLIKGHTTYSYDALWGLLRETDEDPNNSNNVILLYTGRSQSKNSNGGGADDWNREHVWPQSHGDNGTSQGIGTDLHHLRPTDASVNSSRGNLDFDNGGSAHSEATECRFDSDSWEPRDAVKGDVARMMFYMDVRYEGNDAYHDLELVDNIPSAPNNEPRLAKLSTLLQWHQQDPPDAFEMNRNDVIYSYQNNRNPFIDHPEWVAAIYGGGSGGNNPPTITNVQAASLIPEPGTDYNVTATVTDLSLFKTGFSSSASVTNVTIDYSINNGAETSVAMTNTGGSNYSGAIPGAAFANGDLLKFRVSATDDESATSNSNYQQMLAGTTPISTARQVDASGELVYQDFYVRIQGTATVSSGIFSSSNLEVFLQDATGGINIFKIGAGATSFTEGNNYTVTGQITHFNGLAEVIPDDADADIINNGAGTNVVPSIKTVSELFANPESFEGSLVRINNLDKISGTWEGSSNLSMSDDGGTTTLDIRIDSSTDLDENPEPAWPQNVVGIFSQYDNSSPYDEGYQLKPRSIADFVADILPTKYIVTSTDNNPIAGTTVTISAQLADDNNNPVSEAGKVVTWSSTNGGTFNNPTSITDANGLATVDFTVGTTSNVTHVVTATDNSTPTPLVGNSDNITTKAGQAIRYVVSLSNTSPVVGSSVQVQAQLVDANDNNVIEAGKTVTWSSTNGGSFSSATSLTDANGIATVNFTVSNVSNTEHVISVNDDSAPAPLIGSSDPLTTVAGAGNSYIVTVSNNAPTVGTPVQVEAQLVDQFNNPVMLAGREVTWSSTNGGILTDVTSLTNENGLAQVGFNVSEIAATIHVITATDNQAVTGSSQNINTIAGAPDRYIVTSDNYNPLLGETVNISAQLVDSFDNPLPIADRVVTWSSTNGGGFAQATSNTDQLGIATIVFTSAREEVTHLVTATDNESITGTSPNIIVTNIRIPILVSPLNNSQNIPLENLIVSWEVVDGADGYDLHLSLTENFLSVTQFSNIQANSLQLQGLQNATKYYWRVRTVQNSTFSNWSATWNFTTVPEQLGVPLLTSPENNSLAIPLEVNLAWGEVEFSESYLLQVSDENQFSNPIVDIEQSETNYNLTGLQNNTEYFWRVAAKSSVLTGEFSSAWSFRTFEALEAPVNLVGFVNENYHLELNWDVQSVNHTNFVLERKAALEPDYTEIANIPGNTAFYRDETVQQNNYYFYRIKATNANGFSEYSNVFEVLIPTEQMAAPTITGQNVNSDGSVTLQWTDNSSDETGFIISRFDFELFDIPAKLGLPELKSITQIDTLDANATTYTDTSTSEDFVYQYLVSSFKVGTGISLPADNTPIIPLIAPTNLVLQVQNEKTIVLNWFDNSSREEGYIIARREIPGGQIEVIDSVSQDVITYADMNVIDGGEYSYQVYAYYTELGISGSSNVETILIPLFAPTNLNASNGDNGIVNLTWEDNSQGETEYVLERKMDNESFAELVRLSADATEYSDSSASTENTFTYRVYAARGTVVSDFSNEASVVITDVEEYSTIPTEYSLSQNYPNPFNPTTKIQFGLPESGSVEISIYNAIGELVTLLVEREFSAGYHTVTFDAATLNTGVYFYRIKSNDFVKVMKMILVK